MILARVVGNLVSTQRLPAFAARKLMIIQPVDPEGKAAGNTTMAIDYVGAGIGDLVLVSSAPGLAASVFKIEKAPINELVTGIIDVVTTEKGQE